MCTIFIMSIHVMKISKLYSKILSIQSICRYTRYSVTCIRWKFQQIYLKLSLEPIYRYIWLSIQAAFTVYMFWDVHVSNLFVQELRNYKIMYFLI